MWHKIKDFLWHIEDCIFAEFLDSHDYFLIAKHRNIKKWFTSDYLWWDNVDIDYSLKRDKRSFIKRKIILHILNRK